MYTNLYLYCIDHCLMSNAMLLILALGGLSGGFVCLAWALFIYKRKIRGQTATTATPQ